MTHLSELTAAIESGQTARAVALVVTDPSLARRRGEHAMTALHHAASAGDVDVARSLLAAGADLEAQSDWGATALDWAATLGASGVANLLLERGAEGLDLINAASLGKIERVEELLRAPFDPTAQRRRAAPTEPDRHWPEASAHQRGDVLSDAFYSACRNGHLATARLLFERGAAVDARGVFGATALHWAALNGHAEVVRFLLDAGADRTVSDAEFEATPAGWAAEGGHRDLAREIEGWSAAD
ncbi:MAG TPA: ankyrin repeat domain-containing protein [Thermoanaerobaculia bacterium]|nr:ankyrin repeat domain-containing protein [Thermoanaerobaculia bacterium]